MQSRREQVHAHQFMMGRLTSGVLGAEPDAPETPTGRTMRGLVVGTVLAVLAVVGVAGYGLLTPEESTSWRKPGTLIVVNETGARFAYLGGALHPVRNYASAILLLGSSVTVRKVAEAALRGVPRGAILGIDGAPEEVPAAAALPASSTWLGCAVSQVGETGGTDVVVGAVHPPAPLAPAKAVVVSSDGGARYLLSNGRRLLLPADHAGLAALGYDGIAPRAVDASLLAAIPSSPDLAAPAVLGRGRSGPRLGGRRTVVGQLFAVHSTVDQYYLLQHNGLMPVSTTAYDLLRADQRTSRDAYAGGEVAVRELAPADMAGHTAAGQRVAGVPDGWPSVPPLAVSLAEGEAVCESVLASTAAPRFSTSIVDLGALGGTPVAARPGCPAAGRVWVAPNGGPLVAPDLGGGTYLVSNTGYRYPVNSGALSTFGFTNVTPQRIPASLLALLPAGPTLDPQLVAGGKPSRGC